MSPESFPPGVEAAGLVVEGGLHELLEAHRPVRPDSLAESLGQTQLRQRGRVRHVGPPSPLSESSDPS